MATIGDGLVRLYSVQTTVSRSVKTVHTNIFANNRKLHKFTTCNLNFETELQLAELFAYVCHLHHRLNLSQV